VKAHRDGVPPKLEAEIRAFVKQEINHTREHIVFNRAASEAGYDIDKIEARGGNAGADEGPPGDPEPGGDDGAGTLYRDDGARVPRQPAALRRGRAGNRRDVALARDGGNRAQGVAYDTWLHATRDWSRWKRWKVKSLMMLVITKNFLTHRVQDTLDLLAQDGLTGAKWKWRLAAYLLGKPGVLRRIFPAWISYFLPGFHPWQHDDRKLINKADSEFLDARLRQPETSLPETLPCRTARLSAAVSARQEATA
jgi:hypothetical protein